MTALIACIGMLLVPGILQQPTVTLSQDATSLKVAWNSALPRLETSHWVGLVQLLGYNVDTNKPPRTLIPGACHQKG